MIKLIGLLILILTHSYIQIECSSLQPAPQVIFQCDQCSYSASRHYSLILHTRTHTGERPFKCSTCYKSFAISSNWKRHESLHNPDREYKCSECNKEFSHLSFLKTHMKLHTTFLPCTICNRFFRREDSRRKHLKSKRHLANKQLFEQIEEMSQDVMQICPADIADINDILQS